MIRKRRYLLSAMSGIFLAMSLACKSNVHEEQQAAYGYSEKGLGDPGRLSQAEWATYMADQRYVHGLTKPGVRIRLNLADQKQYRFAMARLKLAGKTSVNSPYLFEAMEQRRQKHLARGYQAGLLPEEEIGSQSTTDRREMHIIETASLGETTAALNDGMGTASSTFPGGAYYTYADVSYTDVSGYPLGNLTWAEEFDGGYNVTISAAGDLSKTNLSRYSVSSYKVEDSEAGFMDSYIYTEMGAASGPTVAEVPRLSVPSVQAPLDIAFNDNLISVCLDRTWTQDCDYDLTGNPQSVKLPLKGSVSILSSHIFDELAINAIKQDLNNGKQRNDAGQIKLILTNVGGGCDVTDGNVLKANMAQFWNRVTLSPDKKTLSWDLTGANAAFFDDGCRQAQHRAKLTALIALPLIKNNTSYRSSITLSNEENTRPDYQFKPITITNSCLAAGTEIELAAGEPAAIESLKAGDHVFNPYHRSLTVTDTAVGFETVPMVRIRDEAGRTLLMTEMHPIQVVERGMVQARVLRKGDVVMTKTGPSKLTEVSREAYDGKVYNIKIGSDVEKTSLAKDQTVVYANGFMVGDGQIQRKYESLAMTIKDGNVLARLPSKWHRDYRMSTRGK
jgi:hypothetical protein